MRYFRQWLVVAATFLAVGIGTHALAADETGKMESETKEVAKKMGPGGVEVGFGIFNSNSATSTSQTKFMFGLFDEWHLCDHTTFRPEILYQASGPDYLTIPLMFTHNFHVGVEKLKPFVFLGPEFGFRVSDGGNPGTFKTFNFAIDAGVGADYWLTDKITVGVNWRYAFGLVNQVATAGAPSADTRNMYFLAAFGYKY